MIYLGDNRSIIESIYLNRALVNNLERSEIIVNPRASVGIVFRDKSIIINDSNYGDYEYLRRISLYNDVRIRFKSTHDYISTFKRLSYRSDRLANIKDFFIEEESLVYSYTGIDSVIFIGGYGKSSLRIVKPKIDESLLNAISKFIENGRSVIDSEDLFIYLAEKYLDYE